MHIQDREFVEITEVGLVDGLQLVRSILPTEVKTKWLNQIAESGFQAIDVTSFVPTSVIAQFEDAEKIATYAKARGIRGPRYGVPNLKGAIRAYSVAAMHLSCMFSASEAHSLSNVRRTRDDQVSIIAGILAWRDALEGERPQIQASISCAFGCSLQGEVAEDELFFYLEKLARLGVDDIQLCDTVGFANPRQVRRIANRAKQNFGALFSSLHFHDTRGLGLANVVAGLEEGIRRFDSAIGGLGGCPFAPNASGNIVTEDLVHLLESVNFSTGIDMSKLLSARAFLKEHLPGEKFTGCIVKAGLPGRQVG